MKYDLIYAQTGYVYIVLINLPRPNDSNAPRASHATNDIIEYISHTQPSPYPKPPMSYGQPHGGHNFAYTYPLPDPSCINTYQGTSMSYAYPHLHQSMPGPSVTPHGYPNVVVNPYYPYALSSAQALPAPAPQPPMSPPPLPQ